MSHKFGRGFSLPFRWEYILSSGTAAEHSINLLYGPGSAATSITISPTFQSGAFFVRADLSFVHARGITPGSAFGAGLDKANQPRAMAEVGFILGHNLQDKLP